MKNFDLINRRTHLYLGLALLPWFFMFGFSSFIINYNFLFRTDPINTVLFDKEYHYTIPADEDIRVTGTNILHENDLEGAFWANNRNPDKIIINQFSFWTVNHLTYFPKENRLHAERQSLTWNQMILRMHLRAGFIQDSFWNDLWAWIVDLVCISILLWIASGLYMWWKLPKLRMWGGIALGSGFVVFILMLIGM